jgi:hypothetical protein
MKFRIAMWGAVGFFVSACWLIYAFARTVPISPAEPMVWNLATLSQPIVFASLKLHFGVSFVWVLLANALTYASFGLLAEGVRSRLRHAN